MCAAIDSAMRLTRSEAEAARRLAAAMRDQGNREAVAQAFEAGLIVSLGPGRFVNRALCTASVIQADAISAVVEFFASRDLAPSIQLPGWIDTTTSDDLRKRGFRPDWSRSLLAVTTAEAVSSAAENSRAVPHLAVAEVTDELTKTWLDVLAEGNETPPSRRPISDEYGRAAHAAPDSVSERNLVRAGLVRVDSQTVWTTAP